MHGSSRSPRANPNRVQEVIPQRRRCIPPSPLAADQLDKLHRGVWNSSRRILRTVYYEIVCVADLAVGAHVFLLYTDWHHRRYSLLYFWRNKRFQCITSSFILYPPTSLQTQFAFIRLTTGYHRLWSHRSYTASWSLQAFLLFGGSAAMMGSVKWWTLLHRAHHRWTDTDSDPYNAMRGFWYSHVGWLLLDNINISKPVPMDDIKSNPFVQWQQRHYWWFTIWTAIAFPTLIPWLFWGDFHGGLYIATALRLSVMFQATWCVNSMAHYFGAHTFDDTISPRDHIITAHCLICHALSITLSTLYHSTTLHRECRVIADVDCNANGWVQGYE